MSQHQRPHPRQDRRGIGRTVVVYPKLGTGSKSKTSPAKTTSNRGPTAIKGDNGYRTRGRPVTTK